MVLTIDDMAHTVCYGGSNSFGLICQGSGNTDSSRGHGRTGWRGYKGSVHTPKTHDGTCICQKVHDGADDDHVHDGRGHYHDA